MKAHISLAQSVISKSILPIVLLLQTSLLFACISTAWHEQPEPNFGFTFEFGSCAIDKLDTFSGEFTQERIDEPDITIPLQLSNDQMMTIYTKMIEINIADYPEVFEVPKPLIGEVVMISSPYNYVLTVQNGAAEVLIRWTDDIVQPTTEKADRLRELFQLMVEKVLEHPDYQQLPEVNFGCI